MYIYLYLYIHVYVFIYTPHLSISTHPYLSLSLFQPASELMKKHGINWTDARSEGKGALKQLTEQSKQPCKSAKKHHSNSFRTWPPPLTFHLAHPRLVNILWIGFDIEPFLVSSSIHNQCQDLPCSHIASFQLLRNCSDNTMWWYITNMKDNMKYVISLSQKHLIRWWNNTRRFFKHFFSLQFFLERVYCSHNNKGK